MVVFGDFGNNRPLLFENVLNKITKILKYKKKIDSKKTSQMITMIMKINMITE